MSNKSSRRKQPNPRRTFLGKLGGYFSRLPKVVQAVVFVIGIPGLYVGVLSLLPRISVTPGETLSSIYPLDFPFTISNDGFLDVHRVKVSCIVDRLSSTRDVNLIGNAVHTPEDFEIGDLGAGGRATTFCGPTAVGFNADEKYKSGHLTMVLFFRPDFLPWVISRRHHFAGVPDDKGTLHWVESSK